MDHSSLPFNVRSGELNAKNRELQALQALAQSRLKSARRNFADGIQAAKEVQRDLEWTQRRVGSVPFVDANHHSDLIGEQCIE